MKQILISIKPEWVAKILNGEKTLEIRKSFPKCDFPIDVYIYCSKKGELNYELPSDFTSWLIDKKWRGKVVAKFTLNKVEEIICRPICGEWECYTKTLGYSEIAKASCLENREIVHYLKGQNGYAWQIDNLEIFDEPKELSEFKTIHKYKTCDTCPHFADDNYLYCNKCEEKRPLTKAPQSWCYCEVEE